MLGAIVTLGYPLLVKLPFYQHFGILVLMYATLASAWNILGGYTGQISIGHGAFFGIGAYASTVLVSRFGISPWIGMLAGALVAVVVAVAIGYPTFRLRGHYFVMATIGAAEIIQVVFSNWRAVGGAVGMYIPMVGDSWSLLQFTSKAPYYYIMLTILSATVATVLWLERSKLGYCLKAIREDTEAAQSLGVSATGYKLLAMGLSALFTSLVGSFYAQYVLFIDPESVLGISISVQMCLVAILGGVGTVYGPLLGSLVMVALSEGTRVFLGGGGKGVDLIVYGTLIIVVALFQPQGLYRLATRLVATEGRE